MQNYVVHHVYWVHDNKVHEPTQICSLVNRKTSADGTKQLSVKNIQRLSCECFKSTRHITNPAHKQPVNVQAKMITGFK